MELSVNYSKQAAGLLAGGAIRLDRFKCADWPDMVADARALAPVYVHFPLDAGPVRRGPRDFAAIDAFCRDTGTPFVNLHLVARAEDCPGLPVETQAVEVTEAVVARMIAHVGEAVGHFGADRVIVENVPYFGPGTEFMRACAVPEVVRRVADATGAGLLLDLSHARIAADAMGIDARAYVERLPVDRLRELHVTGIAPTADGTRLQDHMALNDEDWAFTAWALGEIRAARWGRPWTVALEYGGAGETFRWRSDSGVLAEQVPRLHDLVRGA